VAEAEIIEFFSLLYAWQLIEIDGQFPFQGRER
jgi:hypothetical protein